MKRASSRRFGASPIRVRLGVIDNLNDSMGASV
jgi:hypothetical protein